MSSTSFLFMEKFLVEEKEREKKLLLLHFFSGECFPVTWAELDNKKMKENFMLFTVKCSKLWKKWAEENYYFELMFEGRDWGGRSEWEDQMDFFRLWDEEGKLFTIRTVLKFKYLYRNTFCVCFNTTKFCKVSLKLLCESFISLSSV